MKKLRSAGDAKQRLDQSIVLWKGRPFFIVEMRSETKGRGTFCDNREKELTIDITDPEVSLCIPDLGYVNSPRGCFFLQRKPCRRVRQGLDSNNVICFPSTDRWNVMLSKGFDEAIRGSYPNPLKATKMMDETKVIAISRDVAISKDGRLMYKTVTVGTYTIEGPKPSFVLTKGYEHLLKPIEEVFFL